MKKNRKIYFYH